MRFHYFYEQCAYSNFKIGDRGRGRHEECIVLKLRDSNTAIVPKFEAKKRSMCASSLAIFLSKLCVIYLFESKLTNKHVHHKMEYTKLCIPVLTRGPFRRTGQLHHC